MGEEQKVGYEELLARRRAAFEEVPDFTLAVEEEFALLDPATLEPRQPLRGAPGGGEGTELEPHLVGELIASEIEIRTGRCDTFADAADAARRAARSSSARSRTRSASRSASTGTHPWSPWQEQRIIDTPHYRRNDELLRYVVWRNNTFGLHVHVGINGADRAIRVWQRAPQLPAGAARPLRELAVRRGRLHAPPLGAHADLHAHVPALRHPGRVRRLGRLGAYVRFLYETGSITEHTQIWWSVRPHLAFPTVEIRICDAQPDLGEARSLAALCYSLTARIARALDEGEPLPSWPHRLLEENLWRAIRHGLSGELIDLERGESMPARARLEQLVEWVRPVAEELGAAAWLAIPERNAAERQIARHEEGASMEEIFAEQVRWHLRTPTS